MIDCSAKVSIICLDYSTAIGNARADKTRLRRHLDDLGTTLRGLQHLLGDPNGQPLEMSRELLDFLDGCTLELIWIQARPTRRSAVSGFVPTLAAR
jgi:hypothetical protein